MTGSVDVIVHPERCMASGACRQVAPTIFGSDEDGWVVLLKAQPDKEETSNVLRARQLCPVTAIEVRRS